MIMQARNRLTCRMIRQYSARAVLPQTLIALSINEEQIVHEWSLAQESA